MLAVQNVPKVVDVLLHKLGEASASLVQGATPTKSGIFFSEGESIGQQEKAPGFYIITEGTVRLEHEGQSWLICEPGDCLVSNFEDSKSLFNPRVDFPVCADFYALSEFFNENTLQRIAGWSRFLMLRLEVYENWLADVVSITEDFAPEILSYEAGQEIIKEGTDSDGVYTLLSGVASVSVKGIEVGEIMTDEIFGAIASLCGETRTATVRAESTCTVMRAKNSEFSQLLLARPETVQGLITNMARALVSANEQVLRAKGG